MDFLKDYCVLSYFTEEIFQHCQPFTCSKDDDMDDSMEDALDVLYKSKTYEKIERESTGLYYQGSVYVMDHLMEELASR